MKIFNHLFFKNKQENDKKNNDQTSDKYEEIGKLVYSARIQKELSIKELSQISRIPEYIIDAIENNIESIRPKNPFIRSILIKLEECLSLKKNLLVGLLIKDSKILKKDNKEILIRKFDLINTWRGTLIYFLLLISTLFVLKRYFFFNINTINIQNYDEKKIDK